MNSSVESWRLPAFGEVSALRTIIPSVAVMVHAVCIFGMPSTSQGTCGRHRRARRGGGS